VLWVRDPKLRRPDGIRQRFKQRVIPQVTKARSGFVPAGFVVTSEVHVLHTSSPIQGALPSRLFEFRFLRLPELIARGARKRSSLFRDIKAGLFPPPIPLGPRCSGWPEHEVDLVLRARIAGASPDEIRALVARLVAARADLMPSIEVA